MDPVLGETNENEVVGRIIIDINSRNWNLFGNDGNGN